MKRYNLFFVCFFTMVCSLHGQDTATKEAVNTNIMRSEGRIYVVIAVIMTILAGLIFYLIRLDRKIIKVENQHT